MGYDISEMHPDTDQAEGQVWLKAGCMQCEYVHHGPAPSVQRICPNDGSVLLVMEGLIVADDVVAIARLLVKADQSKRQAEMAAVTARADLGRVNDIVNRRITELSTITR